MLLSELNEAYRETTLTICKCERIHPKFKVGTSQHTLLINRISALNIARKLIEAKVRLILSNEMIDLPNYHFAELKSALIPIESIIHKCKSAQSKYTKDTTQYNRYIKILQTMNICKDLIEEALK